MLFLFQFFLHFRCPHANTLDANHCLVLKATETVFSHHFGLQTGFILAVSTLRLTLVMLPVMCHVELFCRAVESLVSMHHGSAAIADACSIWKGLAVLVIHQGTVSVAAAAVAAAWRSLVAGLAVFFHLHLAKIVLFAVCGPASDAERYAIAKHVQETAVFLAAYVPRHFSLL